MRKAFFTVSIGDEIDGVFKYTLPRMEEYCEKYDYELIIQRDIGNHIAPTFAKLEVKNLLQDFDYVLCSDVDVSIKQYSPDIITLIKKEADIYAYDEFDSFKNPKISDMLGRYLIKTGVDLKINTKRLKSYWNSGCCLYTKGFLKYFDLNIPETICGAKDQGGLNLAILNGTIKPAKIQGFGNPLTKKSLNKDEYFTHLYGRPYKNKDKLVNLLQTHKDINYIFNMKQKYKQEER